MNIIPAILPKNQTELNTKVKAVTGLVGVVQIDVCDGKFVPNKTSFKELPRLEEMDYELDLMIAEPEKSIDDWIELQPARIVVHVESIKDEKALFLSLEKVRGIIEVGLALSNETPNDKIEQYIDDIDFIQFMGIKKVGFQGEPCDERVLEKIAYFYEKYPDVPISVDGGVHPETIKKLQKAGASRFVVGSGVFDGNPEENIKKLESLIS